VDVLAAAATVNGMPETVHPLKVRLVMEPIWAPARPEPDFSVPFACEDVQLRVAAPEVSFGLAALAVKVPPGATVYVAVAVAEAEETERPMAEASAAAATAAFRVNLRTRGFPSGERMAYELGY
jgi:hypothetical protein